MRIITTSCALILQRLRCDVGNLEKNIALSAENRADFALIANWIAPYAKVLDLGCGDGALLTKLRKSHFVRAYGVEKDDDNWLKAMNNGIDVIQMDLEAGLSGFDDQSFDVVILSQTLQAVQNTEHIVQEMLRVGRGVERLQQIEKQIVGIFQACR